MKISKFFVLSVFLLVMVLGFSIQAQAELINLGTDSLGYRLIYDNDLDITWYDYTREEDSWDNQVAWAEALSVNFGGNTYTDWRLPKTVDGAYESGYDGTTTAGYNITSSEMGHLFYTELGNDGYIDTNGDLNSCGFSSCLTNKQDFQNLESNVYWSGTEYSAESTFAWLFNTKIGGQGYGSKGNNSYYAIAVRSGRAVVPEPMSAVLFGVGGVVMVMRKKLRRRRHG
jgi:hypothetical protein